LDFVVFAIGYLVVDAPLQPRRLMIALAAVRCKRMLGRQSTATNPIPRPPFKVHDREDSKLFAVN
jgi:hypothetical protein